ncbi:MAG: DUF4384 domain-containing protein [Candidatus Marinimicrobia bacterium]|nr:DUF4384 domain-containing protein [Candidatus Neomarinimicrobiota bacterium]
MKKTLTILMFVILTSCATQNNFVPKTEIINQNLQPNLIDLGNNWCQITTKIAIENISPEDAKKLALQKSYRQAIEYFSGIEVKSQTSYLQSHSLNKLVVDNFSQLTSQASDGIVLEKNIIKESIEKTGNLLYKNVTVKIKVGKQKGKSDPTFTIDASLNEDYFKEGENLELQVTSSKDCYLTIFNIMSDGNVATIFPNRYRENNFLKSNKKFNLPNKNEKEFGLEFELHLLPNKQEDTEIIKIIATKYPINFKINSDFKNAYEKLLQKLISIPKSDMEEIDLQYFIYKKN